MGKDVSSGPSPGQTDGKLGSLHPSSSLRCQGCLELLSSLLCPAVRALGTAYCCLSSTPRNRGAKDRVHGGHWTLKMPLWLRQCAPLYHSEGPDPTTRDLIPGRVTTSWTLAKPESVKDSGCLPVESTPTCMPRFLANRTDHLLLVTGVEAELPVPVMGVLSGRSISWGHYRTSGTGAAIRTR